MLDLDDRSAMQALDRSDVYGSISRLADQAQQAWKEIGGLRFPAQYRAARNIVVSGMGGSIIGAHLVQTVFRDSLAVPLLTSGGYRLPHFVHEESLVVLSSYSGNTEETLASAEDARERGAMVTGITTGGRLARFLQEQGAVAYIFEPRHNPAGQPRLAMGYSVVSQVAMLNKLGYLRVSRAEAEAVIQLLREGGRRYGWEVPAAKNPAKQLARKLLGKVPVLVVAEHLEGAAHVLANQLNEGAKTFSDFRVIPELNHHLMEGLSQPATLAEGMVFVFFPSKLYDRRVDARFRLTREVVEKNGVATEAVELSETTALRQAFELVSLGSYVMFYLAMDYGVDPAPIPWVNYFKEQLAKSRE